MTDRAQITARHQDNGMPEARSEVKDGKVVSERRHDAPRSLDQQDAVASRFRLTTKSQQLLQARPASLRAAARCGETGRANRQGEISAMALAVHGFPRLRRRSAGSLSDHPPEIRRRRA